jgi:uncharacterized membrane protein YdbT with pleckstrin-like domain
LETVVRRHWIVLGGPVGMTLFLLGCLAAARFAGRPGLAPLVGGLLLLAVLWAAWRVLDWRCDLWAVTGERLIDEQGVLAVRMVDSPIETINNITCERTLFGRMLGYGTVNVQTAAERGLVTIRDVGAPEDLRETILEVKERRRGTAAPRDGAAEPAWTDTRECPYCAERIKIRARICRFCGRDVA